MSAWEGKLENVEVYYWPITGLAEPIRMTLAIAGVPFQDFNPKNKEDFMAVKEKYGCQVPFVLIDGVMLNQARAILRHLGRVCTYEGKPLYPTDVKKAYECDNFIELIEDMRTPLGKTFSIQDQAEKEAARAALVSEDGAMGKFLGKINEYLADFDPSTAQLDIGHIYAFCLINMLRQPTFIDGIPPGIIAKYENITKHHEWLANLPPVLAYYADKDEVRTGWKPGCL